MSSIEPEPPLSTGPVLDSTTTAGQHTPSPAPVRYVHCLYQAKRREQLVGEKYPPNRLAVLTIKLRRPPHRSGERLASPKNRRVSR